MGLESMTLRLPGAGAWALCGTIGAISGQATKASFLQCNIAGNQGHNPGTREVLSDSDAKECRSCNSNKGPQRC
jgi:hypothetical protein